ncbi:unnamed protein product [Prunus brigantina]
MSKAHFKILTLQEFFYFFEVRRCEKYTQLRAYKEKLVNNLSLDDDAWSTNVWELTNFYPLLIEDDISKRIDLEPDMVKESSTKLLEKKKAAPKLSKDEVVTSRIRDVSLFKSSSKKILSAEKTKTGTAPSSFARVKHLIGVDTKKVRMAAVMKGKESFAQAKSSISARGDGPKVNKPSSIGDACMSDLLNTNFLSSSFACVGLVDHLCQAGDLGIFSSLSSLVKLEKRNDALTGLLSTKQSR